tara:strand:+ start:795 stop:1961 length:1167 start_codon:yes stop_codon:yes gene_type:complete
MSVKVMVARIFILFVFGMVFFPVVHLSAQQKDLLVHEGNPLVDMANVKITFEFDLYGEAQEIEVRKTCYYYKYTRKDGSEQIYGNWLTRSPVAEYVSDEGWGIRIKFSHYHCPVKMTERVVFDWTDPSVERDVSIVVGERLKRISSASIMFINNMENPTLVERPNNRVHHYYKNFDHIKKSNVLTANRVVIEKLTLEEDKLLHYGMKEEFKDIKVKSFFPPRGSLAVFSRLALSEKDWSRNLELAKLLGEISTPMVLDPINDSRFLPLYEKSQFGKIFPDPAVSWGLNHKYVYSFIYPDFTEDGSWDMRSMSLSWRAIDVGRPKGADGKWHKYDLLDGNYSKIRAGDTVIDLADYGHLLKKTEPGPNPYLWFYDPGTRLLISIRNNQY